MIDSQPFKLIIADPRVVVKRIMLAIKMARITNDIKLTVTKVVQRCGGVTNMVTNSKSPPIANVHSCAVISVFAILLMTPS